MGPTLVLLSGVVAVCMAWAIGESSRSRTAPQLERKAAPFTSVASSRVCAITGAPYVSNALGTSVGSKALTVRQAIVVGASCEFLGSLVGGEVAATISGGILNMEAFHAFGACRY